MDHLQRWSRIFRSKETETDLSIWILTEISGIFGIMASTLCYRKALDNIDLNLVSHRSVSGVLKDDHFFSARALAPRFWSIAARIISAIKRSIDLSSLYYSKGVQCVMDFSSILLRNTRLMAVLRNLFAFLVSVDVVYCQHARKSYLTSTKTRCQLWERGEGTRRIHTRRQSSTGKYIHSFNPAITFNLECF